jgi:hypothetical protein
MVYETLSSDNDHGIHEQQPEAAVTAMSLAYRRGKCGIQ